MVGYGWDDDVGAVAPQVGVQAVRHAGPHQLGLGAVVDGRQPRTAQRLVDDVEVDSGVDGERGHVCSSLSAPSGASQYFGEISASWALARDVRGVHIVARAMSTPMMGPRVRMGQ